MVERIVSRIVSKYRTTLGWNSEDVQQVKELLIKANTVQLNALFYDIMWQLHNRKEVSTLDLNNFRKYIGLPPIKGQDGL